MSYAEWFKYYNGFLNTPSGSFYAERAHTDSITGGALAGAYSLRVNGIGLAPRAAPLAWSFLTYHPFMQANPRYSHGIMRTLLRIESTSGAGRIHAGLNALHGNGTRENWGFGGGYGLVVEGASGVSTWDTLALAMYGNDEYGVYAPPTPLLSAALSLPQANALALQMEFYSWPLDDFSGVRLVGSLGTALDYSDLAPMLEYTVVDYPAIFQARTPGNFQHALMLRFDQGSIKALFDAFEFDVINVATVTVP